MADEIDPEGLGFLVTEIARLYRAEIDRRIAGSGLDLTAGEGRVLAHAAMEGPLRQNVLAERMGVEAMTLCAFLDRLEGRGLIERKPDPKDRRAKLVVVTPAAKGVLSRIAGVSAGLRAAVSSDMSDAQWYALHVLLRRVRDRLSSLKAEGRQQGGQAA